MYDFQYINFDGGELPNPRYSYMYNELPTIFRVLDSIFPLLESSKYKQPVFAIPFQSDQFGGKDTSSLFIINSIKPYSNLRLYETNGQVIFDIRGLSGGIVTNQIFYIIGKL